MVNFYRNKKEVVLIMNKITKLLLMVVYSAIIFTGAFLIANLSLKPNRFKGYDTVYANDDIIVNTQLYETRQSAVEQKKDYEYLKYDLGFSIYKKSKFNISSMYAYVCFESKDGKYTYAESSSSRTMGESTIKSGLLTISNSSNLFAYKKVTSDSDGKITVEDHIPHKMYVKLFYEVTDSVDKTITTRKELNFKLNFGDIDVSKSTSFKDGMVSANDIVSDESGIATFKLSKTVTDATDKAVSTTTYKFSSFNINKDKLEKGEEIVNTKLVIYGKCENSDLVNTKYFSNYIRLFNVYGGKHVSETVTSVRQSKFSTDYNIDQLFVELEITTSTGRKLSTTFKLSAAAISE